MTTVQGCEGIMNSQLAGGWEPTGSAAQVSVSGWIDPWFFLLEHLNHDSKYQSKKGTRP